MKRLMCIACLLLNAYSASAQEVPSEWPEWLRETMMRESSVRSTKKFSVADDRVSGVVKGKFTEKPSLNGDNWFFATDIKADSEFMCWIFPEAVDSASTTAEIADNLISLNAEGLGEVHAKSLYHREVTHLEGVPIIALEWVYTMGPQESIKIGFVKVRTALVEESSIVCAHTSVGYRETFEQTFNHLITNIEVRRDRAFYYEALHVVSVSDRPVGFSRARMIEDAEGDTEIRTTDAMIVPVDGSNVSTSDGVTIEYSFPNGDLINQYTFSSENGNLVVDAQIGFQEGRWVVSGTLQGKELLVPIQDNMVLSSSLGNIQRVRELMNDEETASIELNMWMPDIDPTALSTIEIALDDHEKGKVTIGPMVIDAEFDQHGDLKRGLTDLGGSAMVVSKVWERGAP